MNERMYRVIKFEFSSGNEFFSRLKIQVEVFYSVVKWLSYHPIHQCRFLKPDIKNGLGNLFMGLGLGLGLLSDPWIKTNSLRKRHCPIHIK